MYHAATVKTVKAVVVWILCIHWLLFLLSYIPGFRALPVDPLTGTPTEVIVAYAAGTIFDLIMNVLTFVVLVWAALALSRPKKPSAPAV